MTERSHRSYEVPKLRFPDEVDNEQRIQPREGADFLEIGACRDHDPSTFFPADGKGVEIAKKVCRTCVAKEECLDYALDNRIDHGVWGGTSERQRRQILKKRRISGDN